MTETYTLYMDEATSAVNYSGGNTSTESLVDSEIIARNNIPVPLRTFLILTISLGIIISNILNMAVLRLTDQIPSISRMCLLNLSTADLLVGVVCCTPCIYPAITGKHAVGGRGVHAPGSIEGS